MSKVSPFFFCKNLFFLIKKYELYLQTNIYKEISLFYFRRQYRKEAIYNYEEIYLQGLLQRDMIDYKFKIRLMKWIILQKMEKKKVMVLKERKALRSD